MDRCGLATRVARGLTVVFRQDGLRRVRLDGIARTAPCLRQIQRQPSHAALNQGRPPPRSGYSGQNGIDGNPSAFTRVAVALQLQPASRRPAHDPEQLRNAGRTGDDQLAQVERRVAQRFGGHELSVGHGRPHRVARVAQLELSVGREQHANHRRTRVAA